MQKTEANALVVPAVSVLIGIAYLVGGIAGGRTGFGVFGLVLMVAVGAVLWLLRGRSETVKGLLDRGDERINDIDIKATAFSGVILEVAVIAAFVVEIGRGHDGEPYSWLAALAGVSYIASIIYQRVRG